MSFVCSVLPQVTEHVSPPLCDELMLQLTVCSRMGNFLIFISFVLDIFSSVRAAQSQDKDSSRW